MCRRSSRATGRFGFWVWGLGFGFLGFGFLGFEFLGLGLGFGLWGLG